MARNGSDGGSFKLRKPIRRASTPQATQVAVLKSLAYRGANNQPKLLEVSEISLRSGLQDEKEVLRFLYILEGHKLVSPHPSGDFTAKHWHITNEGVRALKIVESSNVA